MFQSRFTIDMNVFNKIYISISEMTDVVLRDNAYAKTCPYRVDLKVALFRAKSLSDKETWKGLR